MSKLREEAEDDLRPEYDELVLREGVRGKYFDRYLEDDRVIDLEPDEERRE